MNTISIKKMKSHTPRRVSNITTSTLLKPTSSPELFPSRLMKIGRDCDCNCDHDNGHAADKDEFISDVTTFLSSLQPLFETGCKKSCGPGLQSSGSEKILALDASNYEDMVSTLR